MQIYLYPPAAAEDGDDMGHAMVDSEDDDEEDLLNTSDGQAAERSMAIAQAYLDQLPSAPSPTRPPRRQRSASASAFSSLSSSSSSSSPGGEDNDDRHDQVFLAAHADQAAPASYSLADLGITLPAAVAADDKLQRRSASTAGSYCTLFFVFRYLFSHESFLNALSIQSDGMSRTRSLRRFQPLAASSSSASSSLRSAPSLPHIGTTTSSSSSSMSRTASGVGFLERAPLSRAEAASFIAAAVAHVRRQMEQSLDGIAQRLSHLDARVLDAAAHVSRVATAIDHMNVRMHIFYPTDAPSEFIIKLDCLDVHDCFSWSNRINLVPRRLSFPLRCCIRFQKRRCTSH